MPKPVKKPVVKKLQPLAKPNTGLRPKVRFSAAVLAVLAVLLVVVGIIIKGPGQEGPGQEASRASNSVYAVPDSIASDCSRDISTELTSFIATVPNGTAADPNTINFKANGCYQVGFTTQVINRVGLVLAGNNATIQRKNPIALNSGRTNKALLMIASSRNMTIRDFRFIGDNTNVDNKDPGNYYDFDVNREAEHALFIYNDQSDFPTGVSDNTLISNIKIDSVYGDAVRLWGARNVRVEKSLIYGAGRQGVAARGTDRLVIVDNRFDYLRRTAIDFEEDPVTNVRIQRNHFESHKFNLGNFPGSAGADRNILVSNNTAGPDAPLGIRCTTPTTAVKIENNQPAFKNTASAGSGSSDIPCSPQGFDESHLPPLES